MWKPNIYLMIIIHVCPKIYSKIKFVFLCQIYYAFVEIDIIPVENCYAPNIENFYASNIES